MFFNLQDVSSGWVSQHSTLLLLQALSKQQLCRWSRFIFDPGAVLKRTKHSNTKEKNLKRISEMPLSFCFWFSCLFRELVLWRTAVWSTLSRQIYRFGLIQQNRPAALADASESMVLSKMSSFCWPRHPCYLTFTWIFHEWCVTQFKGWPCKPWKHLYNGYVWGVAVRSVGAFFF